MKNLPLERQVCTLEQPKELAELLGDDALAIKGLREGWIKRKEFHYGR